MVDMIFYEEVIDAFKFIFSDYRVFFQIGAVLLVISLIRRLLFYDYYADIYMSVILLIFSELMLYIEVGYCSYISLYTLKGRDYLPHLIINKKLFFEGLKKSFAVYIYTIIILFLESFKTLHFNNNNLGAICIYVAIILVYSMMVLGLMNRFLNHGSFFQTFNIKGMYSIFKNIRIKNFILVLICVFFAQFSVAQCIFPFKSDSFFLNILLVVFPFFISPAVLIFTKRFVALHIRQLFEDSAYSYKLE
jgi:hypothetical protein